MLIILTSLYVIHVTIDAGICVFGLCEWLDLKVTELAFSCPTVQVLAKPYTPDVYMWRGGGADALGD